MYHTRQPYAHRRDEPFNSHTVSISSPSKPIGCGWSIHRGKKMKKNPLIRQAAFPAFPPTPGAQAPLSRGAAAQNTALEKIARSVTIYRDNWGAPHVYGPTDASVIFGFIYAQ